VLGLTDTYRLKGDGTFQNMLQTIRDLPAASPNYGGA